MRIVSQSYDDAIATLLSLVDHERSAPTLPRQKRIYDLRNIQRLLERMGEPQRLPGIAHVAGTKGKGSTAAMIESIMRAAGHSTGFYSSPHLHSFCERIRRNGQPVSQRRFAKLTDAVWPYHIANAADPDAGPATLFEYLTAMAFWCFHQDQTDCSVIEVGLGGKLDATNVVTPAVSAITPVSLDHMAILGDTIGEIAADKAGIIKPDVPVVVAPQSEEAAGVIRAIARRQSAPIVSVGDDVRWETACLGIDGQDVTVHGQLATYHARLPLLGRFQGANAATAVAAAESLSASGYRITPQAVADGLASVEWPCRLEVLSRNPMLVADGAHNDHSVAAVLETLGDYLPHRRLILVTGFSRDKQVDAMVKLLSRRAARVIATRSRHPRSMRPSEIADAFRQSGLPTPAVTSCPQVSIAVDEARAIAGDNDLILVTGSLFVAAEAREAIVGIAPEKYPDLVPADLRSPTLGEKV
jgi:dihydrofolate synthase/folylpolyglutamate synthase